LLRAGLGDTDIAQQLGKDRTTIWRERTRNKTANKSGYNAATAQANTKERRKEAKKNAFKLIPECRLAKYCEAALRYGYSPKQIAGRLKFVLGVSVISHETIYQWVYEERKDLKKYLRRKCSKYRRKRGTKARAMAREAQPKRRIDERPAEVEARSRIGDWEGDTVVGCGHSGCIATLVERKSGYLEAVKLERPSGELMVEAVAKSLSGKIAHTLTLDNGTEMAFHEAMEKRTGATVYFAYPYHSWERGTNENTNGLLRQYFPKKSSFEMVIQTDIDSAVRKINNRPRKRLGYMSPRTVFYSRVAVQV